MFINTLFHHVSSLLVNVSHNTKIFKQIGCVSLVGLEVCGSLLAVAYLGMSCASSPNLLPNVGVYEYSN